MTSSRQAISVPPSPAITTTPFWTVTSPKYRLHAEVPAIIEPATVSVIGFPATIGTGAAFSVPAVRVQSPVASTPEPFWMALEPGSGEGDEDASDPHAAAMMKTATRAAIVLYMAP